MRKPNSSTTGLLLLPGVMKGQEHRVGPEGDSVGRKPYPQPWTLLAEERIIKVLLKAATS